MPSVLVEAFTTPVALLTSTVAFTTAAPEGSVTCPRNVPVATACRAAALRPNAAARKSVAIKTIHLYAYLVLIRSPDLEIGGLGSAFVTGTHRRWARCPNSTASECWTLLLRVQLAE